ncbi:MAG: calcium/sodium antiporter [Spirochaetes bacterium]|nr:calcium/sodium antiporter [Spirochaetota bacterium]MBU0957131.1 calcium/sodium antiporter [Spirochaetota bacterium]
MVLPILAVVAGLALLVWSADRFVDGAAATARFGGMSPLLIGMLIVGFGTSAPEMVVSAFSSAQGNPGLAMGNAYGSNIVNIALILGLTALIKPIMVNSSILKKELPVLTGITLISGLLLLNGMIYRYEAVILLILFAGLVVFSIYTSAKNRGDVLAQQNEAEQHGKQLSLKMAIVWLLVGLAALVISSRMLVWGAVIIAQKMGVSDIVIGLTIVALGTSLPELASSIAAARKGQNDIALGNIIGSNMFNLLAVVGIAGVIHPINLPADLIRNDWTVMMALTVSLFFMGFGYKKQGRINRFEGALLMAAYFAYTASLVYRTLIQTA